MEKITTYKVTTEIKTSWWKKLLRFFKLLKPRVEFSCSFYEELFKKDDIISTDCGLGSFLIIEKY